MFLLPGGLSVDLKSRKTCYSKPSPRLLVSTKHSSLQLSKVIINMHNTSILNSDKLHLCT
uniref:Uncharacterized protein n=1 Tax=Rhizophora mucronata TaxID=61149 RepID=A0A2P2QVU8_RHIMU